MKLNLYKRLDRFYSLTMKNYKRQIIEDEAASTELSFNTCNNSELKVNEQQKPSNELVTSIIELEPSQ